MASREGSHDPSEGALDVTGLVANLTMGESDWSVARRKVRLVAQPVASLLCGCAVIAETVGLDHQA